MVLPAFADFLKSVDMDKLSYDLNVFTPPELKNPSTLFTQEQYEFLSKTIATMNIALLQQYHLWLNERLSE